MSFPVFGKEKFLRRRPLLVWGLFCVSAGLIFVVYALASLAAGRGEFILPLDDVYIHFQYARQLANGQPFVYNPGQPPTSGATSFLYPFILAFGYLLGFQGLNLALWAMMVGALALIGSMTLIYRLVKIFDSPDWLAIITSLTFALTGAVSWHFMSGMETGLMTLLTLATLYTVIARRFWAFIVSASLLALMRPEGGILSMLAVGAMILQRWNMEVRRAGLRPAPTDNVPPPRARHASPLRRIFLLLIPVLMLGVQPLVNWLVTGSAVASGNAAKSILGTIPFDWAVVIRRVLENFMRMWVEFVTGYSPREGWYLPFLIGALAMIGLVLLLIRWERRLIGFLVLAWLVAGTAAVSTLDTAFWHFKRYQMPLIALLFPLAAWGIQMLFNAEAQRGQGAEKINKSLPFSVSSVSLWFKLYFLLILLIALWTGAVFLNHFALNVDYVYRQPLQMARWLQANTPEDAVIAVHDVGMMRYMGGRMTLDMVGLTTPGAAEYWRNGPGSVAEFLIRNRPDYIASYGHGHGYGLGMIADTSIYGEPLASFPVRLDPNFNVALAADFQGIYKPDWSTQDKASSYAMQGSLWSVLNWGLEASFVIDTVDVADLLSEAEHNYGWYSRELFKGFTTEVNEFDYVDCPREIQQQIANLSDCLVLDAGRRIDELETFTMNAQPNQNLILVTRLDPLSRGTFDVYVNGTFIDRQWMPSIPGQWLEIATLIPGRYVTKQIDIRIVPEMTEGYYIPYRHWLYNAGDHRDWAQDRPLITYQNGAIVLINLTWEIRDSKLYLDLIWRTNGQAEGDYKIFAHILDNSGEIVAQSDQRPGNGTLPPGNWFPGVRSDVIVVDLPNMPIGEYQIAIGLYDPYTFERMIPQSHSWEVISDNRIFIGEIKISNRN